MRDIHQDCDARVDELKAENRALKADNEQLMERIKDLKQQAKDDAQTYRDTLSEIKLARQQDDAYTRAKALDVLSRVQAAIDRGRDQL